MKLETERVIEGKRGYTQIRFEEAVLTDLRKIADEVEEGNRLTDGVLTGITKELGALKTEVEGLKAREKRWRICVKDGDDYSWKICEDCSTCKRTPGGGCPAGCGANNNWYGYEPKPDPAPSCDIDEPCASDEPCKIPGGPFSNCARTTAPSCETCPATLLKTPPEAHQKKCGLGPNYQSSRDWPRGKSVSM